MSNLFDKFISMKRLITACICLLLLACSPKAEQENQDSNATAQTTQATVTKINTQKLRQMLDDPQEFQLVDVRTPDEVANGYIDGAITEMNFIDGQFASKLDGLDKTKPIVVYCARGGRSAKAAALLKEQGFSKIYDYTDGYNGWSAQ